MSQLKALLMTSIQDILPLTQYFPLNYNDNKSIADLLLISKILKNCGKGCFQYSNKLFYYKTYFPNLSEYKENTNSSLSQSNSDYFIYSLDCNKKNFFFLFYCDLNYKQEIIDDLANEIFEIFDKGAFDGHQLKQTSRDEINRIFEGYQKLYPKFEKHNLLNIIENLDERNNDNFKKNKNNNRKKRFDSRIVLPQMGKSKNFQEVSADIDDITSIKNNDTNLSMMFRYNINENDFIYKEKEYKKIKIWNIVLCFLLLLVTIVIIILLFL